MPEGPEVRTVADKLRPRLQGHTLKSLNIIREGIKFSGTNSFPAIITKVYSYGKKLIFELSTNQVIITELLMNGRYIWTNENQKAYFYWLIDDIPLYYEDSRKMGKIKIMPLDELANFCAKLGPDLLHHAVTTWLSSEAWLNIFKRVRKSRSCIAVILLRQELVAGIGNYLKSEILYYAGILPNRPMNTITDEELEWLRKASHEIIACSYKHGGLTIESFINPDGQRGNYPKVVYQEEADPSGYPVVSAKINGRNTFWVPARQK